MEHTLQLNISDNIVRNHKGTFDIVFTNLEFQKFNIKNISLSLLNSDRVEFNLLDGNKYRFYAHSSLLYDGELKSNTHLFKYEDIPLSKVIYHKLIFVLLNIKKEIIEQIINYQIEFKWTESNKNFPDTGFGYFMDWSCGLSEEYNLDINPNPLHLQLRFYAGLFATSKHFEFYTEKFIESSRNIFSYDETHLYQLINYNHIVKDNYINSTNFYESEIDIYSDNKLVKNLNHQNSIVYDDVNNKVKIYEVFSETFKVPIQKITKLENKFQYKSTNYLWGFFDGFSNIQLLCDNLKYNIEKITLIKKTISNNLNINQDTFDLEFDLTDYGYKILGLSDFLIIPNLNSHTTILEITFNTQEEIIILNSNNLDELFPIDFWIKLDRYCLYFDPRRFIAIRTNDYAEYPIIDLVDYLNHPDIINNTRFNPNP